MAVIRREQTEDEVRVRAVQVAAFNGSAGESGAGEPAEARLLDELRACDGWLPALSLVVELDGQVVGHNVCTRGFVGDVPCVGLGPIAIDPAHQGAMFGSALMHAMVGAADATGEPLIALLGNPDFYSKFGFVASTELGVEPPEAEWGDFFQVRTLSAWDPSIAGRFRYASPFEDLE